MAWEVPGGPGRPDGVGAPWPSDAGALDVEQRRLASLRPDPWHPPAGGYRVGGCFLAFARGEQGPGHAGDRGWVGAAVLDVATMQVASHSCVPCVAGAPYEAGRLALREGPALAAAVMALGVRPDVLLVDATGRDHPRRGGLALHLGAVLGVPSIGVTHRPLMATGDEPGPEAGSWSPLAIDGEVVGAWLRTRAGARPVAVHAGWRTDPGVAIGVAMAVVALSRTPEPLRWARVIARTRRAFSEGRTRQSPGRLTPVRGGSALADGSEPGSRA